VASWAEGLPLGGDPRHDLVLAVAEAAANAAEHGYGFDGHGAVEVRLRVEEGDVHVEVADRGTWREPADRTDRGRGLIIMRRVMRDVEVERGPGGTTVRMRLSAGS
jgi:anti-sigma regulatory factor (Ser/Thr protein kinase)